jgi:hypothetical protein
MEGGDYEEYRVEPGLDRLAAVQAITDAIVAARERGVRRLLVDVRALAGITPPTLAQRDAMVSAWARAAAGRMAIVTVAPESLVDPERYGVLVAEAAGLRSETFPDVASARAWLLRQVDPAGAPRQA